MSPGYVLGVVFIIPEEWGRGKSLVSFNECYFLRNQFPTISWDTEGVIKQFSCYTKVRCILEGCHVSCLLIVVIGGISHFLRQYQQILGEVLCLQYSQGVVIQDVVGVQYRVSGDKNGYIILFAPLVHTVELVIPHGNDYKPI